MSIIKRLSLAVGLSAALASPAFAQFSSPSVAIVSSAGIDAFAGSGVGSVLTRTLTGWKTLNCANGQVMLFAGVGNNASCYTPSGVGTVTSVSATVPSFMTVTGSPIAAAGNLAFSFNSAAANTFLAAPSGSAGVPTMRALTSLDLGAGSMSPSFLGLSVAAPITSSGSNIQITAGSGFETQLGSGGVAGIWRILASSGALMPNSNNIRDIGTTTNKVANIFVNVLGSSSVPVSNLYLTTPATTLFGNPTNASDNASQFTIDGLTDIAAPNSTADWLLIYQNSTGQFKKVNPSEIGASVSSGVSTVSNSDSSLSVSPTSGAVVASLNLAHPNTWTGSQTLNGGALVKGDTSAATSNAAGYVGERITNTFVGGSIVTGPTSSLGSITLTAGHWVCVATLITAPSGSAVTTAIEFGYSNTTSSFSLNPVLLPYQSSAGFNAIIQSPVTFIDIIGTTTFYVNYSLTFTSTMSISGSSICNRIW